MAGEDGVLGLCTAEEQAATGEENFTKGTPEVSTTQLKLPADGDECTTETQAGIKEAVPEPQAEDADHPDGYDDDDYQDDDEYDDQAHDDDYDYESDYESDYDYEPVFEEERPKVRAALLSFPEAANLEPHELDAAVERVLEQSKPEHAEVAAPGKIRLLKEDIEIALDPWMPPPPGILNDWFPRPRDDEDLSMYPADLIEKKKELARKQEALDKEFLPLYGKPDEKREQFRAKVRKELLEKGYVEVDEDYYDKRDEFERQMMQQIEEEWNRKIDISRFRVANNEEGVCYYSEEHGGYI